jgi:hypothetical protein
MEYIQDCNTAACVFGYVGALLADESFELVMLKGTSSVAVIVSVCVMGQAWEVYFLTLLAVNNVLAMKWLALNR